MKKEEKFGDKIPIPPEQTLLYIIIIISSSTIL